MRQSCRRLAPHPPRPVGWRGDPKKSTHSSRQSRAATRGGRRRCHLRRFNSQRGRAARALRIASANGVRRRRRPEVGRVAAARHADSHAHPRRVGHRDDGRRGGSSGAPSCWRRQARRRGGGGAAAGLPPSRSFSRRHRAVRARGGAARGSQSLQSVRRCTRPRFSCTSAAATLSAPHSLQIKSVCGSGSLKRTTLYWRRGQRLRLDHFQLTCLVCSPGPYAMRAAPRSRPLARGGGPAAMLRPG
jgi:hypothetical protein